MITGVPFQESLEDDILTSLEQTRQQHKRSILLLHCTLDVGLSSDGFGDEWQKQYMPVSSAVLSGLGYDFVLAGHFHSNAYERSLGKGHKFVYPGSPVSLTKKERGPRSVYLLNTESLKGEFVQLPTFYYDELNVVISPGLEAEGVTRIQRWAGLHRGHNFEVRITLSGFTDMREPDLRRKVAEAANGIPVEYQVLGIENIQQYSVYQRFKQLLENDQTIEDKTEIDLMVLKVISRLAERGDLDL